MNPNPKPSLNHLTGLANDLVASNRMPSPEKLISGLLDFSTDAMYPTVSHSQPAKARDAVGDRLRQGRINAVVEKSPPRHVFFVSSSTREGSTFPEAQWGTKSPKFRDLIHRAQANPNVRSVHSGISYWRDGAEEAATVHVRDVQYLRHLMEAFRARYKQKAVIGFEESPGGNDVAHTLLSSLDPLTIHEGLVNRGVEHKTIVPTNHGQLVHVLDYNAAQAPSIRQWAKETGARHSERQGVIHFVGGDS